MFIVGGEREVLTPEGCNVYSWRRNEKSPSARRAMFIERRTSNWPSVRRAMFIELTCPSTAHRQEGNVYKTDEP